jgi:predicted MFS family arabinose efflux permease
MSTTDHSLTARQALLTALGLSMATAIALGFSRFSYALLLAPMREDLGWSYLLAGAMNTANAVGYLLGALVTPLAMRRVGVGAVLWIGALTACAFLIGSALVQDTHTQLLLRLLSGLASALIFITGGLLAARLAGMHPAMAGLLIGVYYGGTGLGIILSALLAPLAMAGAVGLHAAHPWQAAWLLLAVLSLLATLVLMRAVRRIPAAPAQASGGGRFRPADFGFGLSAYLMFGVGYIGYMTFVIALLKEQGMAAGAITLFYSLLGLAVMASSRIWAGMLDRFKGGQPLAILSALLAVATAVPALTAAPLAIFLSGLLFGAVFLSVVASTTALVRHNLPPAAWSAGIGAFTTVFALGQIIGPTMVGWISDHSGTLQTGLLASSAALAVGALLAWRQRPLSR